MKTWQPLFDGFLWLIAGLNAAAVADDISKGNFRMAVLNSACAAFSAYVASRRWD